MSRMTEAMAGGLALVCVGALAVSGCMGETVPAARPAAEVPPVRTYRPSYEGTFFARPRPIEGGSYYYELAEVHKRYGVYDKAVEMLEKAIEEETDATKKARYYESLSQVYQMQGRAKEAAEQIEKALAAAQTVEEKCRYNSVLGRIYEHAGDVERAKKAYQFVVGNATRDTQKQSAQLSLFRLYQRSGELEKVIADLEKKIEQNPDDEDSLNTLAQIFNSVAREPSRALSMYEKLSKLKPKDVTILSRLAFLYQSNKEYEKAAEVYQKMIEASPSENRSYYQQVSRMYMLAGKNDEAIKWAEKSLSERPTSPYTYLSMAQLYLQNNLVEKALQLHERAVEASRRPVEKHQVSLRFADIFARNNKDEEAEKLYKSVMEEATVSSLKSQARSRLIALYRKQGKTSEIEALGGEEPSGVAPPK